MCVCVCVCGWGRTDELVHEDGGEGLQLHLLRDNAEESKLR